MFKMSQGEQIPRPIRSACTPCRRSKRRCGREVPICELCMRKGIECSYPESNRSEITLASQPTSSPSVTSVSEPQPGVVLLPARSQAASIYFLAPQTFHQAGMSLPALQLALSPGLAKEIGDDASMRDIASRFFATIHRWLPIVSKTSFYTILMNPLASRQSELHLLVLAMKLCCSAPQSPDEHGSDYVSLYRDTRRLYQDAEVSGSLSIHVLQAGLLIALHELGQSIYPAAYMTISTLARYGLAMKADGICSSAYQDEEASHTWNDTEQLRRAWWAVLMFDR